MLKKIAKPFNRRIGRKPASRGFVHVILLALVLLGATTYGVVIFQAKIQQRKAQQDQVTPKALSEAKRGLLDFAAGDGIESRMVTSGRLPPLDYFNVAVPEENDDDFFIASRPGQLPCPDTTGVDGNHPNSPVAPEPLVSVADGNLDGVADYGSRSDGDDALQVTDNCSGTDGVFRRALDDGSTLGRFPWNEYYDYVSLIRGVGSGDLLDGNKDRLWYAVAPYLTDQTRPLNQHRLRRSERTHWLEVNQQYYPATGPFVIDQHHPIIAVEAYPIAAVVMSPGKPRVSADADEDQTLRPQEAVVYGETSILSTMHLDYVDYYLEGDNRSASDNNDAGNERYPFTQSLGDMPDYADRLAYVHLDEILSVMDKAEKRTNDEHLDSVADALAAYYERNRHLPDPTSFDRASSEFINRRFGRPAAQPGNDLFSPYTTFRPAVNAFNDIASLQMQGGRIETAAAALAETTADSSELIHYSNLLPLGKLPFSQMPLIMSRLPANAALTNFSVSIPSGDDDDFLPFPPFSQYLSPLLTPSPPGFIGQTPFAAVIPAFTPVRAARPFFTNPIQVEGDLEPDTLATNVSVFTDPLGNYQLADPLLETSGGALGRPDTVRAFVPSQQTNTDVNGNLSFLASDDMSPNNLGEFNVRFANGHPELLFNMSRFGYGVKMPAGTWLMATVAMTVVGYTGVSEETINGELVSQGAYAYRPIMAPSDIFYGTFRNARPTLPDGSEHLELSIPAKTALVGASQGLLPVELLPNQLRGTDATVAFRGHGLLNNAKPLRAIISDDTTPKSLVAVVTDPNGAFGSFPAEVTMHPLGQVEVDDGEDPDLVNQPLPLTFNRDDARFNDRHAFVHPTPIADGSSAVAPGELRVGGQITFPAGSKFHYPVGTKIPLGHRSFNHGHNIYNFSGTDNSPFGAAGVADTWAVAQLAPGAVLHDVQVDAGTILPDGTIATEMTFAAVTLVNGGSLFYDQLLHFDNNDVAMLPQTAAQRGFRIESMGLGLAEYDESTQTAMDLRDLEAIEPDFPSSKAYGYYLYPYHATYERRSQPILPFYRPTVTGGSVASYNNVDTEFLRTPVENLVGRADLWLYDVGTTPIVTPPLTFSRTPTERNATSFTYNLVDGHGVAFTALNLNVGATSNDVGTVNPVPANLTLPFDRGVRLQANPSRMQLLHTQALANVSEDRAILGFAQYGHPLDNTPLVLPNAPIELFNVLDSIEIDYDGAGADPAVIVDARTAELALHFGQHRPTQATPPDTVVNSMINAYNFRTATLSATAPSDALDLGEGLQDSRRAIFRLNSDAILPAYNSTGGLDSDASGLIPAGSHVEYGWLESFVHDSSAAGITRYYAMGGRVFNGVGFYPTPAAAAVRMERDTVSFDGPGRLTIIVTAASNIELEPVVRTDAAGDPVIDPATGEPETDPASHDLAVDSMIVLTEPRMFLPGGFDIDVWEVSNDDTVCAAAFTACLVLDTDLQFAAQEIEIFEAGVITPTPLALLSPTIISPSSINGQVGTSDADFASLAGISFNFAAHSGGYLTAPVEIEEATTITDDTIDPPVVTDIDAVSVIEPIEAIQSSQVMRWSIAPHWEEMDLLTTPATLLGVTELSWHGKDGRFGFGEMEPSTQVFAQNQYIHYAVEDQCRNGVALQPNIDCTDEPESGLEVNVPPGENVRLPEETLSPNGMLFHAFQPSFSALDGTNRRGTFDITFTLDGTSSTVPVEAVQLTRDGQLREFEGDDDQPLQVNESGPLTADPGTTITVTPGNHGILFQYEPLESTSYSLNMPSDQSIRSGYTKPFEIIAGGFTNGHLEEADYQVTVPAGTPINIAGGSNLDVSSLNSFHLSLAGESSSGVLALGGLRTIMPAMNINVDLGANALENREGVDLPVGINEGPILIDGDSTPPVATQTIADGQMITIPPDSNRALQGIVVKGADLDAALEISELDNTDGVAGLLYSRSHKPENVAGHAGIPTGSAPITDLDTYNDRRTGQRVNLVALNDPTPPSDDLTCIGCRQVVLDISQFAIATTASPLPGVDNSYEYPDPLPLVITINEHFLGTDDSDDAREYMGEIEFGVNIDTNAGGVQHTDATIAIEITAVDVLAATDTAPLMLDFTSFTRRYSGSFAEDILRDFLAVNLYHSAIDLDMGETIPINTDDLPDQIAFTIGTFIQGFTFGIGDANFIINGADLPFAIFARPSTPIMSVFDAIDPTDPDPDPLIRLPLTNPDNVGDGNYAQIFSDRNHQAAFNNIEEVVIQLPVAANDVMDTDGNMISLPGGSVIHLMSGEVSPAKEFVFVDPTQPAVNVMLGANGASGQLVGGGGAGRPILHQRNKLWAITEWNNLGINARATGRGIVTDVGMGVMLKDVSTDPPVRLASNQINDDGSVNLILNYLDPPPNFSNNTPPDRLRRESRYSDMLDTRYSNVFGNARVGKIPLINTFHDARFLFSNGNQRNRNTFFFRAQGFSTIFAQPLFSAPETHHVDFQGDSDFQIFRPGLISDDKMISIEHDISYQGVDGSTVQGQETVIQESLLPGNTFTFSDGSVVPLVTALTDIEDIGPRFVEDSASDTDLLEATLRQNLWMRIEDDIVVNGVVDPNLAGSTSLALPAGTVINPFLGTYLLPPTVDVPSYARNYTFNGSNTAISNEDLVFSAPALMLPAGITINSGQVTMTFTDVKAVVMQSSAPLPDAEIDCQIHTFYTDPDTNNIVVQGSASALDRDPGTINQLREGFNVTNNLGDEVLDANIIYSEYLGIPGYPYATYINPVGDAHPCQVLDIYENYDGDRVYTYTSGMLSIPDDPATDEYEVPIQRVNDRMRMVGGILRPLS